MNGYLVLSLRDLRNMRKAILAANAEAIKRGAYKGKPSIMCGVFDASIDTENHIVNGQHQINISSRKASR